jgi:hypothetical protein
MLGSGLLAGTLLDRVLQDSFLHHVAVRVLNPGLVADRSQVLDKPQCMLRVVRMYLRGSARTLRFHSHTHRRFFTMPDTNAPTSSQALHRDGKQRHSLAALLNQAAQWLPMRGRGGRLDSFS